MTKDLTVGKPLKSILLFTLPILIGNIFQQLYSMVDTIIVGQTISSAALAGVGATGAISFLVIGFVQGLTAGFAVKTSQLFGARDVDGIKRSIAASLALSLILSVVLTFLSVYTTMPLLRLMKTPSDIIGYSYDYIVTIYWGLAATVFYNLASSVLRAIGDSRTPLIFLILAAVLNVGFDFLFILVFRMGVSGAGWATVLSQAISALGCFAVMFTKFPVCRIRLNHFRSSLKFYWQHLAIGLPMALQFSITAVGVMVQQAALNLLGTTVVTAYTAASKIDNLINQSLCALGSAVATFCGQNYGAGRYDRIKQGVRTSMVIGVIGALIGCAFVVLCAKPLTSIFITDITDELLAYSKEYLFYQGVFYFALAAIFVYRNALQGIGRSALTMIGGGIELIMRVLASLLLAKVMGFAGISISNPAAWIGADIFFISAYYFIIGRISSRSRSKVVQTDSEGDGYIIIGQEDDKDSQTAVDGQCQKDSRESEDIVIRYAESGSQYVKNNDGGVKGSVSHVA